jgi:DnaJ-class molecular chaperone
MSTESYYQVLGVSKTSTETDIRAAFKRLVLKWHPDKNHSNPEAATKFQEIHEAYQVLHDPTKRKTYDLYGSAGLKQNEENGASDTFELFRNQNYYGSGKSAFDILAGIFDESEEEESFFMNYQSTGISENFQDSMRVLLNNIVENSPNATKVSQTTYFYQESAKQSFTSNMNSQEFCFTKFDEYLDSTASSEYSSSDDEDITLKSLNILNKLLHKKIHKQHREKPKAANLFKNRGAKNIFMV